MDPNCTLDLGQMEDVVSLRSEDIYCHDLCVLDPFPGSDVLGWCAFFHNSWNWHGATRFNLALGRHRFFFGASSFP